MERLTKFVTPVGMCMTSLNSMKHYMPCVPCRHKAELKTDSKGKQYTEKFSFCDTCEVKMLFNRLKECITAIFVTALVGNTVEKVFRVIYDDPEQEGENDTGN